MKHIIHRGKVGANGFPLSGKGKESWLEQERKRERTPLVDSVGHFASKENAPAFLFIVVITHLMW